VLKWCAFCQQFQGEIPPYEDLGITHSVCRDCQPKALEFDDSHIAHAQLLRTFHERLFAAGLHGDLASAERIIEDAMLFKIRGVDLLLGIMAPIMHQVGEAWRRDTLSVTQERSFSELCRRIYDLVAAKMRMSLSDGSPEAERPEALLFNAPANRHRLGLRIIALWLEQKGLRARIVEPTPGLDELVELVSSTRPKLVLISIAVAEQAVGVIAIAARITELPAAVRPSVLVGGYAVKSGMISSIPHAELLADINLLAVANPAA